MSKPFKVLVVEDEKDIRELMVLHLKREGMEITSVENGEDAQRLLHENEYQLVILDWMLPGISGLDICKNLKGRLPVLMVTARADTADVVLGLEMGADDYLVKPFEIPVLLARARSVIRRAYLVRQQEQRQFQLGQLKIDTDSHQVYCGAESIILTPSEFKLLLALVKHMGRVLPREKLIELVQGQGIAVTDRTVDTHVFGLRKKLGACAEMIETIRGVGYRIKEV